MIARKIWKPLDAIFLFIFYEFIKIYTPPKVFQKYTYTIIWNSGAHPKPLFTIFEKS
jgi:hypothetical protein